MSFLNESLISSNLANQSAYRPTSGCLIAPNHEQEERPQTGEYIYEGLYGESCKKIYYNKYK